MVLSLGLFLGISFVLIAGALVYDSSGYFGFASPVGIFYLLFVLFIYVGTILLKIGITLSYAESVPTYPLLLGIAIFVFALGAYTTKTILDFDSFEETYTYANRSVKSDIGTNVYLFVVIASMVLAFWVTLVYAQNGSPLLSDISYRSWAASMSWGMVAITLLLPFSSLLLLSYGYAKQNTLFWRCGIIALGLSLLFMLLTSRRYPVLDFGIWAVCLYTYLRFKEYVDMARILVYGAALAVPFFVGVQLVRHPEPGAIENVLIAAGRYMRNRILLSEATGVNYIFATFPQEHDFFGGALFVDQAISILPGFGHDVSFGSTLFDAVFAGEGGYMPPTFIGEMYADFGLIGYVGLFTWGGILQTIFVVFVRIRKTPLTVVLFAITSGLLGRSLIQGFLSPTNQIKYIVLFVLPLVLLSVTVPELRFVVSKRKL